MTLDWPTVALVAVVLAAGCVALKVALPFVTTRSLADAQKAALEDVNKRLGAVESALMERRRMPGRLG